jgi:hypothetical protein
MRPRGRSFSFPFVESWCGQDSANLLGDLVQEALLHKRDGAVEGDFFSDQRNINNVRPGLRAGSLCWIGDGEIMRILTLST